MEKWILQQINQMKDLKDRVLLKDVLDQVFLGLYEKNKEMYQTLENQVKSEIAYEKDRYSIRTGLMKREEFDVTHHIMSPMLEEDLEEFAVDSGEMCKAVAEGISFPVLRVFLNCSYEKAQQIFREEVNFQGTLVTAKKTYQGRYSIAPDRRYQKKIEELYQIFTRNGIPWSTVHAPYITRMGEVSLCSVDGKIEIEEMEELQVDFGDLSDLMEYDRIPVWNIKKRIIGSSGFPLPARDHINYNHVVSIRKYGEQNGYLAGSSLDEVRFVIHKKDDLTIISTIEEAINWDIYQVNTQKENSLDLFDYPVFTNQRENCFTESLWNRAQGMIKTKAELFRFIHGFGYTEKFELLGYVLEGCDRSDSEKTYDMNSFLLDEIQSVSEQGEIDCRKQLILTFQEVKVDKIWNHDRISFLISELQLQYPEYHCIGRLWEVETK